MVPAEGFPAARCAARRRHYTMLLLLNVASRVRARRLLSLLLAHRTTSRGHHFTRSPRHGALFGGTGMTDESSGEMLRGARSRRLLPHALAALILGAGWLTGCSGDDGTGGPLVPPNDAAAPGTCQVVCDCPQGQTCTANRCQIVVGAVFCCTKPGCPAGELCSFPDGRTGTCTPQPPQPTGGSR